MRSENKSEAGSVVLDRLGIRDQKQTTHNSILASDIPREIHGALRKIWGQPRTPLHSRVHNTLQKVIKNHCKKIFLSKIHADVTQIIFNLPPKQMTNEQNTHSII